MKPPKKGNIDRIARAYKRSTRQVSKPVQYSGTVGKNPAMDALAAKTGMTMTPGATYSYTGVQKTRVPKGKGKAMGMTYGSQKKGKGATKKVKRARA